MQTTMPGRRGMLGGLVLVAIGVAVLLPALGARDAGSYLFVTLGIAFAIAYRMGRQYVYLVPAATLVGFGLGLLIPGWFALPAETASPIFLSSLAAGLVVVYLLAPERKWVLVPAGVIALVALLELFFRVSLVPSAIQPFFVPIILILVGTYLLVEPRTH
jgi:hypothetical protein